jgi:hypothetical protein
MALAFSALLVACSGGGGGEYVGEWENLKNPKESISIVRNGDGFLIVRKKRNPFTGKDDGEEKTPVTLKDGMLELPAGFGNVAYIKASNTITVAGTEFKRK